MNAMKVVDEHSRQSLWLILPLILVAVGLVLYLGQSTEQVPTDGQAKAQTTLTEVSQKDAGTVTSPKVKPTFIYVRTQNDGVRVKVDGEWVGTTPMKPLKVSPGRHVVEAHLKGKRNRRVINLSPGRRKLVKFGL